ncbi:hypothetical protein MRX96_028808 [Rhipicephalus microplus]
MTTQTTDQGSVATPTPEPAVTDADQLVAVLSDAELEAARQLLMQGPFKQEQQQCLAEVVITIPDTGETVKQTLQKPSDTAVPAVSSPVAYSPQDDEERPESILVSEQASPSEAISSPVAPTTDESPESSPSPAVVEVPPLSPEPLSPVEVESGAEVGVVLEPAASPSPAGAEAAAELVSWSSLSRPRHRLPLRVACRRAVTAAPAATVHTLPGSTVHHRHQHHQKAAGQAGSDGHQKHVLIDEAPGLHEAGLKAKGSMRHRSVRTTYAVVTAEYS